MYFPAGDDGSELWGKLQEQGRCQQPFPPAGSEETARENSVPTHGTSAAFESASRQNRADETERGREDHLSESQVDLLRPIQQTSSGTVEENIFQNLHQYEDPELRKAPMGVCPAAGANRSGIRRTSTTRLLLGEDRGDTRLGKASSCVDGLPPFCDWSEIGNFH
jgi:hypothetical protein